MVAIPNPQKSVILVALLAELDAIDSTLNFAAFCEDVFDVPSPEQTIFATALRAKAEALGVDENFVNAFIAAEVCRPRRMRDDGGICPPQA